MPNTTVKLRRTPTPWPKKDVAAAAPDSLTYHGGPLLANVEVTAIYWGSAWVSDALRTQMDEFFGFVVSSSLIDQLAEYSQPGFTIGHGRFVQSVVLGADEPPNPIDDSLIQNRLDALIAAGTVGPPTSNSVYFFFLPSGVTVTIQGQASCQQFCGYHNLSSTGRVYAVDTYDDCSGCQFSSDLLASSTIVASHELCEAITDPQLNAWFSDLSGEEIGDLCAGTSKVITAAGVGAAEVPAPTPPFSPVGPVFNTSVSPSQVVVDGTGPVQVVVTLTPALAPPPPPPPPPPTGQSWTVQREWSNAQNACV